MGKKRNNATKKKQTAKKKKLSSAYGVSVQKGGTIARNNGVLSTNTIPDGNSHAKKQNGASSNGEGNANKMISGQHHGNANKKTMHSRDVGGKRLRGSLGENDEFHRLHASMEERSLALQARNDELRRSKKGRKKQQKGWGQFSGPSTTNFAPAILTLAPKSTQELVDDAANQVAQGMNEIGQRATNPLLDGMIPAPGQSSLAAAASMNWKLRVSNVSNEVVEQPQTQSNPFSALDEDSDSDNDWAEKKTKVVQKFQFKPASFLFQAPASTKPLEMASGPDDIDPDL